MPALPPDKVYVLWTVLKKGAPFTTDKKNAILTEVFGVDAKGNVFKQITIPVAYRSFLSLQWQIAKPVTGRACAITLVLWTE